MGKEFDGFSARARSFPLPTPMRNYSGCSNIIALTPCPLGDTVVEPYIQTMNLPKGRSGDLPTPALTGKLYFSMRQNSPYLSTLEGERTAAVTGIFALARSLLAKYTTVYGDTHGIER